MRGASDHPIQAELDDEAVNRLVHLQSGEATDLDRTSFARWRAQSAAHEAAAREAEDMWHELGQTPTAMAFVADNGGAKSSSKVARRLFLGGVIAASVGGLVLGSGAMGPTLGIFSDYLTRRGERREVTLPDGSTAWLNTETAISVDFSGEERRLRLDAGEALFTVRKDPTRPFIVSAGNGEAQALGTVFAVRANDEGWQVDVAEGTVGVRAHVGAPQRRITAGQRLAYGEGRFLARAQEINAASVGSWQRGKMIFNRQPLGQVVKELQRHRYGRIILTDAKLASLPVTGVFDLEDDQGTYEMLCHSLRLNIQRFALVTIIRPA